MTIAEALIADFTAEVENTRRLLEACPDDRFDWKPHEKSMTLAQLAGHIAETPSWVLGMMESELDMAVSMGEWKPFAPTSSGDCVAKLDECVAGYTQALAGKDDAFMNETWTMRHGDEVYMQLPRHTAIRTISLHHWAHHRGQLTVYLRLLDVPVPATYGPTADDTLGMPV